MVVCVQCGVCVCALCVVVSGVFCVCLVWCVRCGVCGAACVGSKRLRVHVQNPRMSNTCARFAGVHGGFF